MGMQANPGHTAASVTGTTTSDTTASSTAKTAKAATTASNAVAIYCFETLNPTP